MRTVHVESLCASVPECHQQMLLWGAGGGGGGVTPNEQFEQVSSDHHQM